MKPLWNGDRNKLYFCTYCCTLYFQTKYNNSKSSMTFYIEREKYVIVTVLYSLISFSKSDFFYLDTKY